MEVWEGQRAPRTVWPKLTKINIVTRRKPRFDNDHSQSQPRCLYDCIAHENQYRDAELAAIEAMNEFQVRVLGSTCLQYMLCVSAIYRSSQAPRMTARSRRPLRGPAPAQGPVHALARVAHAPAIACASAGWTKGRLLTRAGPGARPREARRRRRGGGGVRRRLPVGLHLYILCISVSLYTLYIYIFI